MYKRQAAIYTWDAGDSGYRLIQHAGGEYAYIDNLVGSPGATGPNRCIEGNSWWSSLAEGKYLALIHISVVFGEVADAVG